MFNLSWALSTFVKDVTFEHIYDAFMYVVSTSIYDTARHAYVRLNIFKAHIYIYISIYLNISDFLLLTAQKTKWRWTRLKSSASSLTSDSYLDDTRLTSRMSAEGRNNKAGRVKERKRTRDRDTESNRPIKMCVWPSNVGVIILSFFRCWVMVGSSLKLLWFVFKWCYLLGPFNVRQTHRCV